MSDVFGMVKLLAALGCRLGGSRPYNSMNAPSLAPFSILKLTHPGSTQMVKLCPSVIPSVVPAKHLLVSLGPNPIAKAAARIEESTELVEIIKDL